MFQDFTSVAALVDLAALRDEVANSGGDPSTVDSLCPADLVVDNFAQVTAQWRGKISFPLFRAQDQVLEMISFHDDALKSSNGFVTYQKIIYSHT